jgi:hypothetical protein
LYIEIHLLFLPSFFLLLYFTSFLFAQAESGMEKAETDRLKVNLESMRKTHGFNAHTAASSSSSPGSNGMNLVESLSAMGRDPESGLNRDDLDSPQVLYKFTRLMERQIGEAESMSRALGDALEERRQFQSRVWEIYERFVVNEASADLRLGLKPVVDQVQTCFHEERGKLLLYRLECTLSTLKY